jgi:hypothetical protein
MRFLWFAGAVAIMVVIISPWAMATFDCASAGEDFMTSVHPNTGSTPSAQSIAELAERIATKHNLVPHVRVTVSAPRIDNPNKPDDPDNRIQDVHIEMDLERKLMVGTKHSRTRYDLAMGGKGTANEWPLPSGE